MKKIVIFLFVAIPLCASNDLTYLLNFLQQPYESGHQYFEKKNRMNSNYEDVINHALDRRFALQILPIYTVSTDAYDDCGCKLPLGQYLFGQCLFLENIYLPSLLSKQGDIFPTDTTKSPCEQFLTQLADVKLDFCAEEKTLVVNLGAFYRFCIRDCIDGYVGLNIPIVHQRHELDLVLTGGTLLEDGESSIAVLGQFFSQFSGTKEFVIQLIQDCKNLQFEPEQNDTGLGDIQATIYADFGNLWSENLHLIMGLNASFATSKKLSGQILWETQLGEGGATIINPYFYASYNYSWYFNPQLFFAGAFAPEFQSVIRIPREQKNMVIELVKDTDLCVPEGFEDFTVLPFNGMDSLAPLLADLAPCSRIKRGDAVMFDVTNTFYDFFSTNLQLQLSYTLLHQEQSIVTVEQPEEFHFITHDAYGIEAFTQHSVGWNITYEPRPYFIFQVGSTHVVAGTGTTKDNQVYGQFLVYF